MKLQIRDGQLAVTVYEPQNRIGDVLMIHGYTGSKEDFSFIGPLLADEGYRVVTSDNRGQHESDHSDRADAYTIASLAADHAEIAHALGLDKPHLFGHSFGGLVAQRAAVDYPELWRSLTIFCSGPHGMPEWVDVQRDIDVLENGSMAELWESSRAASNANLPMLDTRIARWHASDKRSVITHGRHLLSEPSIVSSVAATDLDIHVVRGEHDDAWPHNLQTQMAADLGTTVTVIPGTGHCPNEDDHATTAQTISQWWGRFL